MRVLHLFLSLILLTTTCFGQYLKPIRGMQFVNRTHRHARGLVYWGLFNEGSGNKVFDLSGNGNNSPAFGASVTWASGPFGSALDFTNAGAGVPINNSSILKPGTGDMTWVIWIDMDNHVGSDDFLSDRPLGAVGTEEGFVIGASGSANGGRITVLLEALDGSVKNYTKDGAYTVEEGLFQLAVTWNNSVDELLIYKNGIDLTSTWTKATDSDLTGKSIANNSDFIIGARPSGDREIDGRISQVLVYNFVKSASEIAELYREPFGMFQKDNTALITSVEAPPPPTGGQFIIIQMSMIPLFLIFTLVCFIRGKENGK